MKSIIIRTIAILAAGAVLLFGLPVATQSASQSQIIELKQLNGAEATALAINNIYPGGSGAESVVLRNTGSTSASITIWLSNVSGFEGTPTKFGFAPTAGGDLKDRLEFNISGEGLSSNFNLPALVTGFPQSDTDGRQLRLDSLVAGAAVEVTWHWMLPYAAGNEVQGDSLTFDINYGLTQAAAPAGGGGGGGYAPFASPTAPAAAQQPAPEPATVSPPGGGIAKIRTIELIVPQAKAISGITEESIVVSTLAAAAPGKKFSLSILSGTQITIANDNRPDPVPWAALGANPIPSEIDAVVKNDIPSLPEGWVQVSDAYDINGVTNNISHGIQLDQPALIVIQYDESLLPEVVEDLAVFYYNYELGWTQLQPPEGYIAEAGEEAAEVDHFSLFVVLAKPGVAGRPAAPPRFEIQKVRTNPDRIRLGQSSAVTVIAANTGGTAGEYVVTVRLDNKVIKTQSVRLKPGEKRAINLTLAPGAIGSYTIQAGDLWDTLEVDPRPDFDLIETDYWWLMFMAVGVSTLLISFFRKRRGRRRE